MTLAGIDLEYFVNPDLSEVECKVCHFVVRDAMYAIHCNLHKFCRNCIAKWIEFKPTCPVCRDPLTMQGVGKDYNSDRMVKRLAARCLNGEENGPKCDWQGPYEDLLRHEGLCGYMEVNCEHCGVLVQKRHHLQHLHRCPKMEQPCVDCLRWVKQEDMDHHVSFVCGNRNMSCPLQCQEVILRKDCMQHILTSCVNSLAMCPVPGCSKLTPDVDAHDRKERYLHRNLLMQVESKWWKFSGPIHSFKYSLQDITRMVKSNTFSTGQHDFKIMLLPLDRNVRDNLGLFLMLYSGHPTYVNVRVKITYGTVTDSLEGKMFLNPGEVKGWRRALQPDALDGEASQVMDVNILIQHFLP